jgi:hypothetical protein
MIKLIVLVLGLIVGFGIGVYWGVHHPVEARKLADEEERRFVEAQKKLLERLRRKLDELTQRATASTTPGSAVAPSGTTPTGRSGFAAAPNLGPLRADPEVEELKRESDRQLQEANRLLEESDAR